MQAPRISQAETARRLGLSVRQVKRLAEAGIFDRRMRSGRVTYALELVESYRQSRADEPRASVAIMFRRSQLELLASAGALDSRGTVSASGIVSAVMHWRGRARELRTRVRELEPQTEPAQELDRGLLDDG